MNETVNYQPFRYFLCLEQSVQKKKNCCTSSLSSELQHRAQIDIRDFMLDERKNDLGGSSNEKDNRGKNNP